MADSETDLAETGFELVKLGNGKSNRLNYGKSLRSRIELLSKIAYTSSDGIVTLFKNLESTFETEKDLTSSKKKSKKSAKKIKMSNQTKLKLLQFCNELRNTLAILDNTKECTKNYVKLIEKKSKKNSKTMSESESEEPESESDNLLYDSDKAKAKERKKRKKRKEKLEKKKKEKMEMSDDDGEINFDKIKKYDSWSRKNIKLWVGLKPYEDFEQIRSDTVGPILCVFDNLKLLKKAENKIAKHGKVKFYQVVLGHVYHDEEKILKAIKNGVSDDESDERSIKSKRILKHIRKQEIMEKIKKKNKKIKPLELEKEANIILKKEFSKKPDFELSLTEVMKSAREKRRNIRKMKEKKKTALQRKSTNRPLSSRRKRAGRSRRMGNKEVDDDNTEEDNDLEANNTKLGSLKLRDKNKKEKKNKIKKNEEEKAQSDKENEPVKDEVSDDEKIEEIVSTKKSKPKANRFSLDDEKKDESDGEVTDDDIGMDFVEIKQDGSDVGQSQLKGLGKDKKENRKRKQMDPDSDDSLPLKKRLKL